VNGIGIIVVLVLKVRKLQKVILAGPTVIAMEEKLVTKKRVFDDDGAEINGTNLNKSEGIEQTQEESNINNNEKTGNNSILSSTGHVQLQDDEEES